MAKIEGAMKAGENFPKLNLTTLLEYNILSKESTPIGRGFLSRNKCHIQQEERMVNERRKKLS